MLCSVNSEIVGRILFSRIALKLRHICDVKIHKKDMIFLYQEMTEWFPHFSKGFIFMKLKPSRKFPNLQYIKSSKADFLMFWKKAFVFVSSEKLIDFLGICLHVELTDR